MKPEEKPDDFVFGMRVFAVVMGVVLIWMGRTAISEGFLWNTGYNARIGDETSVSTMTWVIYGMILVVAGAFPWKWVFGRKKR
jgi:predicted metal-binding membrane protein